MGSSFIQRLARLACLAVLSLAAFAPVQAAFIPFANPVALSALPNGQLTVGDKLFSMFQLDALSFGGSIAPNPATFFVQGGQDSITNDFGLRFLLAINTASGQSTSANLTFKVTVLDPQFLIGGAGVGMVLSGSSANGNGVVNISETIFANSSPNSPILGSLSVSKQFNSPLADLQQNTNLTVPSNMIFVRKDISVTGGQVGAAHLGEFFQFYHQVIIPEVSTFTLGILSLAMVGTMGIFRKYRRKDGQHKNLFLGCGLLATMFFLRS